MRELAVKVSVLRGARRDLLAVEVRAVRRVALHIRGELGFVVVQRVEERLGGGRVPIPSQCG